MTPIKVLQIAMSHKSRWRLFDMAWNVFQRFHRINQQLEVVANAPCLNIQFDFLCGKSWIDNCWRKPVQTGPLRPTFLAVYSPCCSVEGSRVPQIPPMVTKNCCLHSHQEATNMAACGLLRSLSSNFFTVLPLASRSSPLSPLRLACKPYFGRTLASSSRETAGISA